MLSQNNLIQIGNYTINFQQDIIAQGRRGPILKCRNKETSQLLCVKVLNKSQKQGIQKSEIDALKKLKDVQEKHVNALRIYDVIEQIDKIYIFSELCNYTFEQYLEQRWNTISLNLDEIQDCLGQIVRGYLYLQRQKINVKELTPNTILVKTLSNNRILLKISDFCIYNANESQDCRVRTPYYQAPEIFSSQGSQIKQIDFCDIYSLGLILYMMCFKEQNLMNSGDFSSLTKFHEELRAKRVFQCPKNSFCSQELCSLISKMIVYCPEDRIKWDLLDQKIQPYFIILKDIYFVDLKQVLGSGAQGVTHIAYDLNNNENLVCKIIQNKNLGTSREIQIFEQIKGKYNDNVIKIVDLIKQSLSTYLIMEKCDLSLQNYLEEKSKNEAKLNSKEIIDILYQIVEGYCFLKLLGVIHRDLKPDNILIKRDNQGKNIIKIIDFGVGKIIGREITSTEAGTPLFAAPEVLQPGTSYNYQCDIFSLGVILYYLAFQRMFKDIRSKKELLDFHKSLETQPFVCPNHQNPLISELINNMIVYDPNKRISWDQLQAHSIFDEMRQSQTQQIQYQTVNITGCFTEIYQYIFCLHNLALKIFTYCEECQKENPTFNDEILLSKQLCIGFQKSCLICIDRLRKYGVINLNGKDYRPRSTINFENWLTQINLQQLKQQNFEKQAALNETKAIYLSQIISKGYEIIRDHNNTFLNENQNTNFLNSHYFFNKFYQLIKITILKSDLPLKFKFFMHKFSNVFIEYPVEKFESFEEKKIILKIIKVEEMENYIASIKM